MKTEKDRLSGVEFKKRLEENGPNEFEVHKANLVLKLIGYFWD